MKNAVQTITKILRNFSLLEHLNFYENLTLRKYGAIRYIPGHNIPVIAMATTMLPWYPVIYDNYTLRFSFMHSTL